MLDCADILAFGTTGLIARSPNTNAIVSVRGVHCVTAESGATNSNVWCPSVESVMGGHIFHCWADGIKAEDVIGYGTSGYVALLPNSNEVIKVPHPGDTDAYIRCAREIEVYKRFETTGGRRPQSIVGYKGLRDDGSLRLEYAEGGNFKQHLSNLRDKIRIQDCFRWAKQAAQSLVFCHSNSVLHGDICCNNFFLDQHLNLKLGDFAGSSIDQLPALVCYHTTHQLPGIEDFYAADEVKITIETEIFAFGSFLYEMSAGIQPYESLTDGEIEKRFRQRSFPDVTRFKLGPVITSCWNLKFHTMAEVLEAIENTSHQFHRNQTLSVTFAFFLFVHVFHTVLH